MPLRGLLKKAKSLAEENLPSEVLDASRKLRDSVMERAPDAVTDALERIGGSEDGDAPATPTASATSDGFTARRDEALQRVKSKADDGLKPEDSLVVVYATAEERDAVAHIETIFDSIDTVLRVMDLDKEPPQTKTQLAKLTGVMVPPYVYINGRYWGAHFDMESLAASGDLENIVANRLDNLSPLAKRMGRVRETYDDEITVENILERWKLGHILCVDDLDAWYEVDKDGTEHFYCHGGPRPVEDMPTVAEEIVAAVEAEEYEATWQLEPTVALDG
ncbi:MAG: hypothetical protein AAGA54_02500 [Myxococcota bacterium]